MLVINPPVRELAPGLSVVRALPTRQQRHVGPFVFLDHLPLTTFAPQRTMDIAPHPHIGLATVSYLFDGEILHRDSVGSSQLIRPGDINWMTAGRGIVHSERSPLESLGTERRARLLQCWVGLPKTRELEEPHFKHYPGATLPELTHVGGARVRLLAGAAWGERSPVETASPTFFADAELPAGAVLRAAPVPEQAMFVVEGRISVRGSDTAVGAGSLVVFDPASEPQLHAEERSRIALLGGEPLDGPRFIWWNFVSSSEDRIVEAARLWKAGGFAKVPGDEHDFVPLEMEPHFPKRS